MASLSIALHLFSMYDRTSIADSENLLHSCPCTVQSLTVEILNDRIEYDHLYQGVTSSVLWMLVTWRVWLKMPPQICRFKLFQIEGFICRFGAVNSHECHSVMLLMEILLRSYVVSRGSR